MAIKILRFKNGLDVICKFEMYDDIIEIEDAMVFEVRGVNLALQNWAPTAIIKENKTHIMAENVLCFFEPTDEFEEYYSETVTKLKETMNELKNKDDNQIEELLKEFTDGSLLKGSYVH